MNKTTQFVYYNSLLNPLMKKAKKIIMTFATGFTVFLTQINTKVFAADIYAEPMRLREAESIFVNVIIAIWVLSIPYFMFVVGSIGVQWMLSGGDEQKLTELKTRGKNVVFSFALVFGGYLAVRLVMSLLGLRDPNKCFDAAAGMGDSPVFQFFFPGACDVSEVSHF
ncbi:hypothetical protein JW766_01145 [Candidatus Dojkabacteria bacterium]|nr:hypothetical protein [Candidatus Dojkabacteria bacterium]